MCFWANRLHTRFQWLFLRKLTLPDDLENKRKVTAQNCPEGRGNGCTFIPCHEFTQEEHFGSDSHSRLQEGRFYVSPCLTMGLGLSPLTHVTDTREGGQFGLRASLPSVCPGGLPRWARWAVSHRLSDSSCCSTTRWPPIAGTTGDNTLVTG